MNNCKYFCPLTNPTAAADCNCLPTRGSFPPLSCRWLGGVFLPHSFRAATTAKQRKESRPTKVFDSAGGKQGKVRVACPLYQRSTLPGHPCTQKNTTKVHHCTIWYICTTIWLYGKRKTGRLSQVLIPHLSFSQIVARASKKAKRAHVWFGGHLIWGQKTQPKLFFLG